MFNRSHWITAYRDESTNMEIDFGSVPELTMQSTVMAAAGPGMYSLSGEIHSLRYSVNAVESISAGRLRRGRGQSLGDAIDTGVYRYPKLKKSPPIAGGLFVL